MEYNIVEIIGNLGFPIAMVLVLLYQNFKLNEKFRGTLEEFKEVIHQNTRSIDKLIASLENKDKGV